MTLQIILPAAAAIAILCIFYGLNRMMQPEIDVSGRLGAYQAHASDSSKRSDEDGQKSVLTRRMDKAVANKDFATRIASDLARADLKFTVSEYIALHVIAVFGMMIVLSVVTRSPVVGLVGGIVGFYLPRVYVSMLQKKRLKALNNQLPDTLGLIVNSIRSGYSLLQSMELVAREAPQPTKDEFYRVVREVSLGLSPEQALNNMVRRVNSDDLDLVVTAINVQHEVGGNLAQILESIASTIRERVKVKGEVSVLTAQQRLSGYLICAMPIGLAGVLFLINSKYMMNLFSFEKVICMPMIGLPICSGVMMIVGFLVIKKIVAIDV